MRQGANHYAWDTFGLTEEQLICMAYSPFAGAGAGLADFLGREHPALVSCLDAIHAMLADPPGEPDDGLRLAGQLKRISGLGLSQLRLLYRSPVPDTAGGGSGVIGAVLEGDPHKAVIRTRHTSDGPHTDEQISGR